MGYEIVDALCSSGPTSVRQPGQPYDFDGLLTEHSRFGITRRLCLHAESRDGVPEEGNAEMARLAGEHVGTGVVWTVLPPRRFHAEPLGELMQRAQTQGVAAFALFPKRQVHRLAPWAMGELYGAMAEARLPLYLDFDQCDWDSLYEIARACPALPLALWNAPYRSDRFLIPILDQCANLRVGLATRFVQSGGIEDFCGRYGPGRLIYGSKWPAQSPGPLISYVTYARIEDSAKQAILSGNITRLVSGVAWPVKGFEGPV